MGRDKIPWSKMGRDKRQMSRKGREKHTKKRNMSDVTRVKEI